jgi:hypothetical protein
VEWPSAAIAQEVCGDFEALQEAYKTLPSTSDTAGLRPDTADTFGLRPNTSDTVGLNSSSASDTIGMRPGTADTLGFVPNAASEIGIDTARWDGSGGADIMGLGQALREFDAADLDPSGTDEARISVASMGSRPPSSAQARAQSCLGQYADDLENWPEPVVKPAQEAPAADAGAGSSMQPEASGTTRLLEGNPGKGSEEQAPVPQASQQETTPVSDAPRVSVATAEGSATTKTEGGNAEVTAEVAGLVVANMASTALTEVGQANRQSDTPSSAMMVDTCSPTPVTSPSPHLGSMGGGASPVAIFRSSASPDTIKELPEDWIAEQGPADTAADESAAGDKADQERASAVTTAAERGAAEEDEPTRTAADVDAVEKIAAAGIAATEEAAVAQIASLEKAAAEKVAAVEKAAAEKLEAAEKAAEQNAAAWQAVAEKAQEQQSAAEKNAVEQDAAASAKADEDAAQRAELESKHQMAMDQEARAQNKVAELQAQLDAMQSSLESAPDVASGAVAAEKARGDLLQKQLASHEEAEKGLQVELQQLRDVSAKLQAELEESRAAAETIQKAKEDELASLRSAHEEDLRRVRAEAAATRETDDTAAPLATPMSTPARPLANTPEKVSATSSDKGVVDALEGQRQAEEIAKLSEQKTLLLEEKEKDAKAEVELHREDKERISQLLTDKEQLERDIQNITKHNKSLEQRLDETRGRVRQLEARIGKADNQAGQAAPQASPASQGSQDDSGGRHLQKCGTKTTMSASVEVLKGELHVEKQKAFAARREANDLETERQKLVAQVVNLESQRRKLLQESDHWRERCLGFEKECANLATQEDVVHAKLREATTREKAFAVKTIESRITHAEMENAQAKAQSEAAQLTWQCQQLESKLGAKSAEVDSLRAEVVNLRTASETRRREREGFTVQMRDVQDDRDMHKEGLVEAQRRQGVLEERASCLESALQASTAKQAEFAKEVAKRQEEAFSMEETNRKLRMDLQEAISQAVRSGEVPFYSGSGGRFQQVPAVLEDMKEPPRMGVWSKLESELPRPLTSPISSAQSSPVRSPLSARSRLDYPKTSRARQLRHKVLSARGEALDYVDLLAREKIRQ